MADHPEFTSVNDLTSVKPFERGITLTDAQRILVAATLEHAQARELQDAHRAKRDQWWQTKIGLVGAIAGIIFGLILAGSALYSTFIGGTHPIAPAAPVTVSTPTAYPAK